MLKALLVDMEGVLLHSAAANAAAFAAALRDCGAAPGPAHPSGEAGGRPWPPVPVESPPPVPVESPPPVPVEVARCKRARDPDFIHLLQPNQRVVDLVRLLHGPLATALVTTASHPVTEAILAHLGLADLFDTLVTGDHVLQPKPAPEGFAMAALLLHARPEECLVIEGSELGMIAARAFCGGLLRWSDPPARHPAGRGAGAGTSVPAALWAPAGSARH